MFSVLPYSRFLIIYETCAQFGVYAIVFMVLVGCLFNVQRVHKYTFNMFNLTQNYLNYNMIV